MSQQEFFDRLSAPVFEPLEQPECAKYEIFIRHLIAKGYVVEAINCEFKTFTVMKPFYIKIEGNPILVEKEITDGRILNIFFVLGLDKIQ